MTTTIKKARWQAGLNKHFDSHSIRFALLLAGASLSSGAVVGLLCAAITKLIGGAL